MAENTEVVVDVVETDVEMDDLFDMSDAELEVAFKQAKAEIRSPNTDIEADETTATEDVVEVDDLEQPSEGADSDDNSTEEDVEVDTAEESEKDEPEVEVDSTEKEVRVAQTHKFKANGKEFEFTEDEIFTQFGKVFGQAMDYTKKMQAIAPYRVMIDTIKEQKLTQDDLNLMVDVLKGDKAAAAALLGRTGIDALDLEPEAAAVYRPKNYGRNETELAISDIVDEIKQDPEYKVTYHVVENEWDDKSRDAFRDNPSLIKELHLDVKNGVFDQVIPRMLKLKVIDGARKPDIDYYIEAGNQFYRDMDAKTAAERAAKELEAAKAAEQARLAKVKAEESKRDEIKRTAEKRKAAAPTTTRASKVTNIDFLDDSDEGFEKWYKDLQNR